MIPEAEIYYYKARVYDPCRLRQRSNPYSYVFNDPVNATDPSGLLQPGCSFKCQPPNFGNTTTSLATTVGELLVAVSTRGVSHAELSGD